MKRVENTKKMSWCNVCMYVCMYRYLDFYFFSTKRYVTLYVAVYVNFFYVDFYVRVGTIFVHKPPTSKYVIRQSGRGKERIECLGYYKTFLALESGRDLSELAFLPVCTHVKK